jgi:predicted transposase YdaD
MQGKRKRKKKERMRKKEKKEGRKEGRKERRKEGRLHVIYSYLAQLQHSLTKSCLASDVPLPTWPLLL